MKRLDLVKHTKIVVKFFHKWSIHLLLITIVILLLFALFSNLLLSTRGSLFNLNPSPTPSPTTIPTPSPTPDPTPTSLPTPETSPAPTIIYKETPPTPIPVPISTQAPLPTPDTKMDSATHIELCKTEAETFKTQTETAMVLVYNQTNPSIIELANASTIYETKIVAIKYGMINEGDLESNFTVISNYLTNTHDWAVKQLTDYMAVVNGKGNLAYNDYYAKCLNYEN